MGGTGWLASLRGSANRRGAVARGVCPGGLFFGGVFRVGGGGGLLLSPGGSLLYEARSNGEAVKRSVADGAHVDVRFVS